MRSKNLHGAVNQDSPEHAKPFSNTARTSEQGMQHLTCGNEKQLVLLL